MGLIVSRTINYAPARGVTLIELMLVLMIVAIIVALAIPAYKGYSIRAKVSECIYAAAAGKLNISEFRLSTGAWPANSSQAGIDAIGTSKYCTALNGYQPTSGAFTIDVNENAIAPGIGTIAPVLKPVQTLSRSIIWTCTRGATENTRYIPSNCRGT